VFWHVGMQDTSWEVIAFLLVMGAAALALSYYKLQADRTDDDE